MAQENLTKPGPMALNNEKQEKGGRASLHKCPPYMIIRAPFGALQR